MKFSVITITYNNAEGLNRTLDSVFSLTVPDGMEVEIIVVDGASKDNTNEIAEKYRFCAEEKDKIEFNYKSEPDKGIYDAMNKGIDRATGDWMIFMNAGDCFFSQSVLMKSLSGVNSDVDILYGDIVSQYNGRYCLMCSSEPIESQIKISMPIFHQATLFRSDVVKQQRYSMQYRITGDYDLIVRLWLAGCRFIHTRVIVSLFEYGGVSIYSSCKTQLENLQIHKQYKLISDSEYRKSYFDLGCRNLINNLLPDSIYRKRKQRQFEELTRDWKSDINKVIPSWYTEEL